MATLKYYISPETASLEPAYSTAWDDRAHMSSVRGELHTSIENNAEAGANNSGWTPGASNQTCAIRQFVASSAPGAISWTTSDTFSISIKCIEANAAQNDTLYGIIRVVSSDGATFRGTLFAGQMNSTEFSNSDYTSRFASGLSVQNNVSQQATDLIVLELGVLRASTDTNYSVIRAADANGLSDLPENNTTTGNYNSWISFTYGSAPAAATNVVMNIV